MAVLLIFCLKNLLVFASNKKVLFNVFIAKTLVGCLAVSFDFAGLKSLATVL